MEMENKQTYDDFYVAYFDMRGNAIYPSDKKEVEIIKKMLRKTTIGNIVYIEEKELYYKKRVKRSIVNGIKVQIVELSNITEYMNQVSKASVDEITQLDNRKVARQLFREYIERAYDNNEEFAVLFIDLDNFKQINDTYGHANGDIILSEISRILYCVTRQELNREQDIVARLGGDEFVIVLKNVSKELSIRKADFIHESVKRHRALLYSEEGEKTYISVGTLSTGLYHVSHEELVTLYEKGYTTDEIRALILDRCDSALYLSKNNGKNRITVYNKEKSLELKKQK